MVVRRGLELLFADFNSPTYASKLWFSRSITAELHCVDGTEDRLL
jgi:hypothetical protein